MARTVATLSLSFFFLLPSLADADDGVAGTVGRARLLDAQPVAAIRPLSISERSRASLVRRHNARARQSDSLLNGAIIGAAIGAGYGSFVLINTYTDVEPSQRPWILPVSAGIGAGVGMLVDYLRR